MKKNGLIVVTLATCAVSTALAGPTPEPKLAKVSSDLRLVAVRSGTPIFMDKSYAFSKYDSDGKRGAGFVVLSSAKGKQMPPWVSGPAVSPNGKQIAFYAPATKDSTKYVLWLWDTGSGSVRALTDGSFRVDDVAWFSDSKRLLYKRDSDDALFVLNLASGKATPACAGQAPMSFSVTADRIVLFAYKDSSTSAIVVADGKCKKVIELAPAGGWQGGAPAKYAVSPDGKKLAVNLKDDSLWVHDFGDGSFRKLANKGASGVGVGWVGNDIVVFSTQRKAHPRAGWSYSYDLHWVLVTGGKPARLIPGPTKGCSGSIYQAVDGAIYAQRECKMGRKGQTFYLVTRQ